MGSPIPAERLDAVVALIRSGLTSEQAADQLGLTYSQVNQTRRKAVRLGLLTVGLPGPRRGCADEGLRETVHAWADAGFVARRAARALGLSDSGLKKRLLRAAELGMMPTKAAREALTAGVRMARKSDRFDATVRDLRGAIAASAGPTVQAVAEQQAAAFAALTAQVEQIAQAVTALSQRAPVASPDPAPATTPAPVTYSPQGHPELLRRQLDVVVAALGPERVASEVPGLSARTIKLGLSGSFGPQVDAVALDRLYVLVRAVDLDLDEHDVDEASRWFQRARRDRLDSLVAHQGGHA